jgi:uncharacterized protein (TIGR03067 family)
MRLLRLVLILGLLLAGCKAISAGDSAEDTKAWQGTWKLVSATYDGAPQMADMEWVVDGDHYNIRMDGKLGEDPYMIKLDAGRVDVFHHDTPPGTYGGKLKGIYEISGDSLTVCYDLTEQAYPTSFDAPRGSRRVLYKFQRE